MSLAIKSQGLRMTVNGEPVELLVQPHETLLQVLRERLDLTGVKEGCGEGACGACTVLVDGLPRRACLTLALEADGCSVLTVEGLADDQGLSIEQQAFIEAGAVQCGFCTPGMLLASHHLLEQNPRPDEAEIRRHLSGHICRCTGYAKIVEAVSNAAARKRGEEPS